jgi:hypothetical protein
VTDGTSLAIAEHPDAITPDWLTAALRASGVLGDGRVASVTSKPLGTGQMCDSWRMAVSYADGSGPTAMVAKLPAADPTSRATALALRNYEREVRFYQLLAPSLPIATPNVFYADIDPATAAFVLLMQDMSPAGQGDQLAGCSVGVAEKALAELVGLHAPHWNDESLHGHDWLYSDPEAGKQMMSMMLPIWWNGFRERYAAILEPHVHEAGDGLFAKLDSYLTKRGPQTIVHGDYRLDNLLIHPDLDSAQPITVVDWQTVTIANPMQDVAYFIGAGLLEDDRREAEERLVRGYHAALGSAGVSGYEWDECWDDYRRGTFAGLVMAIAASMLVEQTDRGDQMFMAMASRHARQALDLDAHAAL